MKSESLIDYKEFFKMIPNFSEDGYRYLDEIISKEFPCHKNHKYNSYYEGNMDFYTCPVRCNLKSTQKCEWCESNLEEFISELSRIEGKIYSLSRCLDIENDRMPEIEVVNIEDVNERIIVEVKSINELNEVKRMQAITFENFCDMLETQIVLKLRELEEKNKIRKGGLFDFYESFTLVLDVNDDIRWTKESKHKFIEDVADKICYVVYNNLLNIISKKNKFCINISFAVECKSTKNTVNFNLRYVDDKGAIENNLKKMINVFSRLRLITSNEFVPPAISTKYVKKSFEQEIKIYYESCKNKFETYNLPCYRKILLINNNSFYNEKDISERIIPIDKPSIIDEVWLCIKKYEIREDYCNEDSIVYKYTKIL